MDGDATLEGSDGGPEVAVCPMCFGENSPLAARCVHCGAFSTGRSATLPFEISIAQGWALGEVVSRRRPTLVLLVGGWLLLLPTILTGLLLALGGVRTGDREGSPDAVAPALLAAVCAYLLARTTRNYVRGRRAARTPAEEGAPGPGEEG